MDKRTIELVIDAFIVIVGVAVERFLKAYPLGDSDPAFQRWTSTDPVTRKREVRKDGWYWLCYTLALIVLVTLVLRFLLGSDTEMKIHFLGKKGIWDVNKFIWDVISLMFFGAFLVGAALAKSVRAFMGWLSLSSSVGVVWTVIALVIEGELNMWCRFLVVGSTLCLLSFAIYEWMSSRSFHIFMARLSLIFGVGVFCGAMVSMIWIGSDLLWWWLAVNSAQCALSFGLYRWCRRLGGEPGDGRAEVRWVLSLAVGWYALIFFFDLQKIVLTSLTLT